MIIVQGSSLAKSYGAEEILKGVAFQVNKGSRIGIVGRNGAGKSTLLKIVAGIEEPDLGNITKGREIQVGYLSQHFHLPLEEEVFGVMLKVFNHLHEMRGRLASMEQRMSDSEVYSDPQLLEKVMLQYSNLQEEYEQAGGYSYESKIRGLLAGLGFTEADHRKKVREFSGGQQTRLALVQELLREPDVLLLDEPTNHLDIATTQWLEDYLVNYSGTVILISHDRYFLDRVCTEIWEIRAGKLYTYSGNYSAFQLQRAHQLLSEEREYQKQQAKIAKLEAYIDRYRAGIKSKQARGRQSLLDRMEKKHAPELENQRMRFSFDLIKESGRDVLKFQELEVGYTKAFSPPLQGYVQRGEKIGIIGENGIGKTTLLKTIMDQLPPLKGQFTWGAGVTLGYFAQTQEGLKEEDNLIDQLQEVEPMEEGKARNILATFLFNGDDVFKKVKALSGGERSRILLAKLMLRKANVLILDEPTNHLDIEAREGLEEVLEAYPGTIIMVSHDRYFLDQTVNKIWNLTRDGLEVHWGDYTDYLAKKELDKKSVTEIVKENKPVKSDSPKKSSKVRIGDIEEEIASVEERLEELAQVLAQEEIYQREDGGKTFIEEYSELQAKLEELYIMWEDLASQ